MELRKRLADTDTSEKVVVSTKKQKLSTQNRVKIDPSHQNGSLKKEKGLESKVEETLDTKNEYDAATLKWEDEDLKNLNSLKNKKLAQTNQKHLSNNSENKINKSSQKLKEKEGKIKEEKDVTELKEETIKVKLDAIKVVTKTKKTSKHNDDIPVVPPLKYESLGCGPSAVPYTGKKYVGCHVSAAGGVWNCFSNGEVEQASSIALFLRNQRSWNAKPLDEETVKKWDETIGDYPRHLILPHGSYLMNLGSPKPDVLTKSRQLFVEELQRCEKLGIPHFNFHPGSTLGEISREDCCKLISESINIAHKATSSVICVIENMSRQGFTVGGDFHEIRLIIEGVEDRSRVGVCIDTCHTHAAGYDLATEKGFNIMVSDFEKIIGWQFLRALHVNDSKGKVGDHKDRHEEIGKGYIGREGFQRIMNYPRFNDIPLILETPYVKEGHYAKEIKLLQNMIK